MERLGDEVRRTLSQAGDGRALALAEISTAWPLAVGEVIARQAWPLRLGRDGTLHVATTSATWAFELDRLAPEIAVRLEAAIGGGAPTRLRFRVGPVPEPGGPTGARSQKSPEVVEVPPEVTAEAAEAAAAIEDPALRSLVARAARASLLHARSGRRFW
jgi:hypothetical protein